MASPHELAQDLQRLRAAHEETRMRCHALERRMKDLEDEVRIMSHQLPEGPGWALGSVLRIPPRPKRLEQAGPL